MTDLDARSQHLVDRYFDDESAYWQNIYRDDGLQGLVYRLRMQAVLRWIDDLGLPAGSEVLEVGCGAGLLSAALSDRGLVVTATDSSPEMVETVQRAAADRPGQNLTVLRADAQALPFAAERFQAVVALGLLPWLPDPDRAVQEMSRVLAPSGWMILTADNRARLNFMIEPRENPFLTPLRRVWGELRGGKPTWHGPSVFRHLPHQVDQMLKHVEVAPVRRATVGYGPFTFRDRKLLADRAGRALHRQLERASLRAPSLRRVGWHYIVSGRKSAEPQHT